MIRKGNYRREGASTRVFDEGEYFTRVFDDGNWRCVLIKRSQNPRKEFAFV
jgi:hypothetical protein